MYIKFFRLRFQESQLKCGAPVSKVDCKRRDHGGSWKAAVSEPARIVIFLSCVLTSWPYLG